MCACCFAWLRKWFVCDSVFAIPCFSLGRMKHIGHSSYLNFLTCSHSKKYKLTKRKAASRAVHQQWKKGATEREQYCRRRRHHAAPTGPVVGCSFSSLTYYQHSGAFGVHPAKKRHVQVGGSLSSNFLVTLEFIRAYLLEK